MDGRLVGNRKIRKKKGKNRGRYGRLLRYVYVDGLFVNAEMIKQGYAYAYTKYPFNATLMKLMKLFKQYERDAK